MRTLPNTVLIVLILNIAAAFPVTAAPLKELPLPWIKANGRDFMREGLDQPFRIWGFNYDHDDAGRLLENYWEEEWETVVEDFQEMKSLGANVVRVHLQFGRFMLSESEPNHQALANLSKLVNLAESTGLYLNLTGLGCYHKDDVPPWYDALSETNRWRAQSRFWESIAKICHASSAVICYDLMNEPVLPGRGPARTDWLAGAFAGKHFVQYLALDLGDRTRPEVAKQWVNHMVAAIRRHDTRHMITVGVIPWAMTFPGAKPIFYSEEAGENLDFVSVHFYPERGKVDRALEALAHYDAGKPLVIEEIFPLKCGVDELDQFIESSRRHADGWIGFYWGKTREQYAEDPADLKSALIKGWLDYFAKKRDLILDVNAE